MLDQLDNALPLNRGKLVGVTQLHKRSSSHQETYFPDLGSSWWLARRPLWLDAQGAAGHALWGWGLKNALHFQIFGFPKDPFHTTKNCHFLVRRAIWKIAEPITFFSQDAACDLGWGDLQSQEGLGKSVGLLSKLNFTKDETKTYKKDIEDMLILISLYNPFHKYIMFPQQKSHFGQEIKGKVRHLAKRWMPLLNLGHSAVGILRFS